MSYGAMFDFVFPISFDGTFIVSVKKCGHTNKERV